MINKIFIKRKSAFSLVELLVSMAIISVLLGLVGFGIATAQSNSRDSQRRQKVADMKIALESYSQRKNRYPSENNSNEIALSKTRIVFDQNSSTPIIIELSGPTEAGSLSPSTPVATVYCYQLLTTEGGYLLGVLLENGQWYDQSSSLTGASKCNGAPNTILSAQ